jgi:hypothetical protein
MTPPAMTESNAERSLATLIEWEGLPAPAREYQFNPSRKWRFDFAWIEPTGMVAVEVEGGSFSGGRHVRGAGFEADMEKYNDAALRGWKVLRVTPRMIEDGRALWWIRQALKAQEAAA